MSQYQERFSEIIATGNSGQLNEWLKTLDEKSRHSLVPIIKKDIKRLHDYRDQGRRGWKQEGTREQLNMLGVATICCYLRKNIKSIEYSLIYHNSALDSTLSWYCPEWLTDYINSFNAKLGAPINYEKISDWLVAGYLSAVTPELIARKITTHSIEHLEKYEFTLSEHIWTIFHYPCDISWSDSWYPRDNKPADSGDGKWRYIFKKYTQNQRLDRMRVLKESLLAVNRGFNKDQTNWYATLFSALEPTVDECLQLQDELFAVFCCPQSKPINTVLPIIKTISDHPAFRVDEFIMQLPLLFSSTTKGIVNTALALADRLAKQKDKRAEICQHLTGVFLNKDPSLQNKAAKLLVKYGDPTSPELSGLLMGYADILLSGARETLTDFFDAQPVVADFEEELVETQPLIREDNRIPDIENWDDFVFLAGRAFLNTESYHFDQFPATLLRFAGEINEDNVAQLEPAFAQACRVLDQWSSTIGYFDRILAAFFLQYGCKLIERYPQQTHNLQQLQQKHAFMAQGLGAVRTSRMIKYYPYIDLLSWVLSRLDSTPTLPLLSTPTHTPCFIDAHILVERLSQYQQAGVEPCHQDMQLAIQRCAFGENKPVLDKLDGEYAALMDYFLHGNLEALARIQHIDWKLAAIITRSNISPDVVSYDVGYVLLAEKEIPAELLSNIFSWHLKIKKTQYSYNNHEQVSQHFRFDSEKYWRQDNVTLFYEYGFIKSHSHSYDWGPDKRRALFSFPWFYDTTLARFIETSFDTAGIKEVKPNLEMLQALFDLPLPLTPMGHLFTALCLLHSDKTVRALAAELWIDKLRRPGWVNSALIGDTLGRLEAETWAPLKRFTDLAMQSMIGISTRHNVALLEMVSVMDSYLSDVKITNYKKLAELRLELTRM